MPTFQVYSLARYKKCKTNIAIPRERNPSKKQEKLKGYMEGDPNTCSRKEAHREREREREETTQERLGPLIY